MPSSRKLEQRSGAPVALTYEPTGACKVSDDPNPDTVPPDALGAGENICRECEGTGEVDGKECPECGGTGKVTTGIGGA